MRYREESIECVKEEALVFAKVTVPKGYQALFVSPILDMKVFVDDLSTREDDYYGWVINNPITHWDAPLFILRPEVDLFVSEEVGRDFISRPHLRQQLLREGYGAWQGCAERSHPAVTV